MSRRQERKRRRARERRGGFDSLDLFAPSYPAVREEEFLLLPAPNLHDASCGRCHEFIEDGEAGRGTCLHPASGVMFPWYNTPACPFFRGA
jgi:hypothetical protein